MQVTQKKKVQIIHLHLSMTSDSHCYLENFLKLLWARADQKSLTDDDANNNESRNCTFGSSIHVQCTAEYIIKHCSNSILCVAHKDDFNSESMKHDKISR